MMELKEAIEQVKDLISDMCIPTPEHIEGCKVLVEFVEKNFPAEEEIEDVIRKHEACYPVDEDGNPEWFLSDYNDSFKKSVAEEIMNLFNRKMTDA